MPNVTSRHVFAFFAGLDGTGHHLFGSMLRSCPYCNDASELRHALLPWWFLDHAPAERRAMQSRVTTLFRSLMQRQEEQPLTIWFLNVFEEEGTGQLSYPNGASARFMPHVDLLASAARAAQAELYIVALHRDAASVEASVRARYLKNYQNRWGSIDAAHPIATAMVAQATSLRAQLMALAPEQLMCLHYETLPLGAGVLDRALCRGDGSCAGWSFLEAAKTNYRPGRRTSTVPLQPYQQPMHTANLQLMATCKTMAELT